MYEIQSGRAIEVNVRATAVVRAYQQLQKTRRVQSKKQTHLLGRPKGRCHRPFVASCLLKMVRSSRLLEIIPTRSLWLRRRRNSLRSCDKNNQAEDVGEQGPALLPLCTLPRSLNPGACSCHFIARSSRHFTSFGKVTGSYP